MSLRDRVNEAMDQENNAPGRVKAASRTRSQILVESWDGFGGKGTDGVARFSSRGREVTIARIEFGEDGEESWVDIWSDPKERRPSIRVMNPPLLVPDNQGDIRVTDKQPDGRVIVRRYREDPLAAIVDAIGGLGR